VVATEVVPPHFQFQCSDDRHLSRSFPYSSQPFSLLCRRPQRSLSSPRLILSAPCSLLSERLLDRGLRGGAKEGRTAVRSGRRTECHSKIPVFSLPVHVLVAGFRLTASEAGTKERSVPVRRPGDIRRSTCVGVTTKLRFLSETK
jgi:hypothetical protein